MREKHSSRREDTTKADAQPTFAVHGWVGVGLVALAWPLNWFLPGNRTHLLFFPLWLGYILIIDALVLKRTGTSIFTRSRRDFLLLFIASAPAWWIFEVINWRTQNWEYIGREQFSDLTYFVLASVAFSTVMPAVFETAELFRSFGWIDIFKNRVRIQPSGRTALILSAAGLLMLSLLLTWPVYFYPFFWGALYCLLEPVNVWLGRRTLLSDLSVGDWRPVAALGLGALTCGFFWELWNYHAMPKWTYHTPGVEFLHIFEMPLLGYIGYIPFALELYALAHLVFPEPLKLNLLKSERMTDLNVN